MLTKDTQIIQVRFFEPVNGKTDYFFGSIKAIYEMFTPEQIGCQIEQIHKAHISQHQAKTTRYCRIIKQGVSRLAQKK